MSNRSKQQLLDDRLEALGRLERRSLLLRLSAGNPRDDPCLYFGEPAGNGNELDPYVAMRRLHLPLLAERGFVQWDRETHEVRKGPRFDELDPFLVALRDVRDELPDRWV